MIQRRLMDRLRTLLHQVKRFLISGGAAAFTDIILINWPLTKLGGLAPVYANLISRPVGGIVSFSCNKFWTFRDREQTRGVHIQFMRYWMVWGCTFLGSQLLVWIFSEILGFGPMTTKIGAEAIVGCFSFLLQRHWTFR